MLETMSIRDTAPSEIPYVDFSEISIKGRKVISKFKNYLKSVNSSNEMEFHSGNSCLWVFHLDNEDVYSLEGILYGLCLAANLKHSEITKIDSYVYHQNFWLELSENEDCYVCTLS